jgi:hypothetical protein
VQRAASWRRNGGRGGLAKRRPHGVEGEGGLVGVGHHSATTARGRWAWVADDTGARHVEIGEMGGGVQYECSWASCHGPDPNKQWHFVIVQKNLNEFELIWLKDGLLLLEKFQIKYGMEGFEERDNFLHRNFFRFELNFEWKFREASRLDLIEFLHGTSNLDETWTKDI